MLQAHAPPLRSLFSQQKPMLGFGERGFAGKKKGVLFPVVWCLYSAHLPRPQCYLLTLFHVNRQRSVLLKREKKKKSGKELTICMCMYTCVCICMHRYMVTHRRVHTHLISFF